VSKETGSDLPPLCRVDRDWLSLSQNNVLAPGPNHEVIRFVNNGLKDFQHGPGGNNEFVKAGRALDRGVRSVGKALGF
jgi:hypothetical protein